MLPTLPDHEGYFWPQKFEGIFIGDSSMLGAYTIEFPEDRKDARAPTVPINDPDRLKYSILVVQIHGNAWLRFVAKSRE